MAPLPPDDDYYEVLGISLTATTEEVIASYRRLAKIRHPDRGGSDDAFQQLANAHETLKDSLKRMEYNMRWPDIRRRRGNQQETASHQARPPKANVRRNAKEKAENGAANQKETEAATARQRKEREAREQREEADKMKTAKAKEAERRQRTAGEDDVLKVLRALHREEVCGQKEAKVDEESDIEGKVKGKRGDKAKYGANVFDKLQELHLEEVRQSRETRERRPRA